MRLNLSVTPAKLYSVPGAATILHADLDAFYASVEVRDRPELRGKPVAVGGGVILSATYEARAMGVEAPMSGRKARELCPRLIILEGNFEKYLEESRRVMAILDDFTPRVEAISIDEAFLDVSGARRLLGTPEEIGAAIRRRVRQEVGLPISVGIACTKHLAKVASRACKPDGLLVVEPDEELDFLHPLPVEAVWGIGAATAEKLHLRGVRTVAELARVPEPSLVAWLGTTST